MLLPPTIITTARIATVEPNHILLAVDRDRALIFVVQAGEDRFAVFLTGEYAQRGFKIAPDSGGMGAVIGPVELRVDPASVSAKAENWYVRAADNSLSIEFGAQGGGFLESQWAKVAEVETPPDTSLYFAKWALGVQLEGEWIEMVNFDGEAIGGALVP